MNETIIKRKPGRPKGSGKNNKNESAETIDALRRKPGRPRVNPPSRLVPIPVTEEFYKSKPPKLGHPYYYEPWMCDKLIEVYAQGGHETQACIALGVRDPDTLRAWRKKFPEFEEAWQWAKVYSRAYDEQLLEKGINGEIKGYNVTAHCARLNSRYPNDYRRNGSSESTTNTVNINTINMTTQERADKIAQITQKLLSQGYDIPQLSKPVIEGDIIEEGNSDD